MAAGLSAPHAYNVLARHYDALMGDVPYGKWAEFIVRNVHRLNKTGVRIVDAGCGTGTVALALSQRGYKVTGIDQSEQMLTMARYKSDGMNLPVTWLRTSFARINLDCDVVISTCDGVNHLLSPRDLVRFFTHAYICLSEGGLFIFDLNSEYKFCHILADNTFHWQIPGLDIVWENDYSPPFNRANITLYEQSALEKYTKSQFEIRERCYKLPSLLYYLRRSGFRNISLWNNYKGRLKTNKASRITVVAYK